MNIGYKIKSKLKEEQVEADVSSYLGYVTPIWSKRFRVKPVDEQETGADKLFDRFVPIYLQFKASKGLKPLKFGFNLTSPNRDLQKIRRFRRNAGLGDDPILYFKLRNLAKNADDFQHNILKSLHDPPNQHALYVAPLALTVEEYNRLLEISFLGKIFSFNPFYFRNIKIFNNSFRRIFQTIPFLRGHISIPPHVKVSSSDHFYAFSKNGCDVSWHSDEEIGGDFRLGNSISNIYQTFYGNNEIGFDSEQYSNFINNFMDSDEYTLSTFSTYLKENFNISLLLLGMVNE